MQPAAATFAQPQQLHLCVLQVIDVPGRALNNVITFQNGAAFIVDSSLDLDADNPQRLNFKFSGAKLKLPKRTISLPPFGKGWCVPI